MEGGSRDVHPLCAGGQAADDDDVTSAAGWVTFQMPESDGPIDIAYGDDQLAIGDLVGAEAFAETPWWLRPSVWSDVPAAAGR